ncbi:hypothetical protein HMPREF9996_00557 [Aggregatibacter actinomycetemcomitans Y4]|nr:hypothetical protein HMPREF9996_00557 [Aggregatibacter actinomycetemcomitans Y4]
MKIARFNSAKVNIKKHRKNPPHFCSSPKIRHYKPTIRYRFL